MTELTLPRKKRSRRKIILLGVAIVVGLWIILLTSGVLLLRADIVALQEYGQSLPTPLTLTNIDMQRVNQHVTGMHRTLSVLRVLGAPLLTVMPALSWVPDIGGDLQAAPALFDIALQFTDMGQRVTSRLAAGWPPGDQLSLESAARVAQQLQPEATALQANLDRVVEIRSSLDPDRVSSRIRSALQRFDEYYPMFKSGLTLLEVAPQLLGADRARTYLILLQNEDELRATGGFISAVARVTLDAGKIISLTVEDSYQLDDFTTPYPDPPAPLQDYMGLGLWVFRDSNWSPDFPTAAKQVIRSYTQTRGGSIDGVIALDQAAVEALVSGLGPLPINPAQTPITASDIRQYMRAAWATRAEGDDPAAWFAKRKAFIGQLLKVILDRITTDGTQIQWAEEGRQLDRVLQHRDLLITFSDPTLNQALHTAQFDGALRDVNGDYVLVVDSNLGYNKANAVVQESFAYTVTLGPTPEADLTIVYTHTGQPAEGCVHQVPNYSGSIEYDSLVQQCYWDYRRVYVPMGAELIEATRHPTQAGELITGRISDGAPSTTTENNKTMFGTLLIVPRGQRVESGLHYRVPLSVLTMNDQLLQYRLTWQKQAGVGDWPVRITVTWPKDYYLLSAQPQPIERTDRAAIFQFTLDKDQEVLLNLSKG
jgi:hypothetical protein